MDRVTALSGRTFSALHPLTEDRIAECWQEIDIYTQLAQRAAATHYILREMPTPIHHFRLDTLKCKIHQDVFLKVNMMQGKGVAYTPYWNYYTPVVERRELHSEPEDSTFDSLRFRRQCRREFQHGVKHRQQQLEALGIFGDCEGIGKTLDTRDEVKIINTFSQLWERGYLIKDRQLSYWCQKCQTTLDADEIEIRPAEAYSGYVKFPVSIGLEEFGEDVYFLVWLQDLWHLAGSVAIGLKEDSQYLIAEFGGEVLILTEEDLSNRLPAERQNDVSALETCRADVLTTCTCAHPFLGIDLPVVVVPDLSQHDRSSSEVAMFPPPTGVRHLAPGHHPYDYEAAQKLQLAIPSVVDDLGRLTEDSDQLCGLEISQAEKFITFELEKRGYLVYTGFEDVPQPHCGTCGTLALFRPVQQWIFSLDSNDLRQRVLRSDDSWGRCRPQDRVQIQQTIEDLSDICVSRHRGWSIPIPLLQCDRCGYQLSDDRILKATRDLISRRGTEVWFKLNAEYLLPPKTLCPNCEGKEFRKESTLLDGRFAVLLNAVNRSKVKKKSLGPVDVYFFAPNEFDKWFAQFVLTLVALHDAVPSNIDLTAVGSHVPSIEINENWIDEYPKDVLRLLCVQPDSESLSIDNRLQACQNEYHIVQTICAEILSCLEDFSSEAHQLALETLLPLDALALSMTNRVLQAVDFAYQQRDFHHAWCVLKDFCQSDLQRFYLPVLKDRLNVPETTREKRSGQTALWNILHVLIQRLAPITPFLSEQIHALIQTKSTVFPSADGVENENGPAFSSVFLKDWRTRIDIPYIADADARWRELSGV
ncbi:MAG: class I tRNA ligase family protein [Candidatus Poribacteria bacterium]|nr:class I tRNA ligase family protein [Candidatus Poribacteria bacterium]